jgi:hypothetical protein
LPRVKQPRSEAGISLPLDGVGGWTISDVMRPSLPIMTAVSANFSFGVAASSV